MPITSRRKFLVYLLLATLLIGHGYDVATSKEHWPFSPYYMYADLQRDRRIQQIKLVGVTTPIQREMLLNGNFLRNSLTVWQNSGPSRRSKIASAARAYLVSYNKRRQSGKLKGPKLSAIRVYQFTWDLDPQRPHSDQPDEKRVLAEVRTTETQLKGNAHAKGRLAKKRSRKRAMHATTLPQQGGGDAK